ncbi:MAG: HEAT repeat domain-containing protein [Elusimicrobia bacterium]|nr:HEAT repeat domain-containing protein [Elusimicrobiota bacterium]
MLDRALWAVGIVAEGRPSMGFVIVTTIVLLGIVLVMSAYLMVLRAYINFRARYRARRGALYAPGIELVLMEEPYEAIRDALRPRRWGDGDIVQEVIVDSMRHLQGAPFELLRRAAVEFGFIGENLRALRSWDRHRRGHAMERLGLLRDRQAVPHILALLSAETLDMKLVALRALAAIGDHETLPHFLAAAERMPPGLLPRTASMMLEFGAPGRDAVRELLNHRSGDFPAASVPDLLRELSQDWGGS